MLLIIIFCNFSGECSSIKQAATKFNLCSSTVTRALNNGEMYKGRGNSKVFSEEEESYLRNRAMEMIESGQEFNKSILSRMIAEKLEILKSKHPERKVMSSSHYIKIYVTKFARDHGLEKYFPASQYEKIFECDICCKKFSFKNVLVKHRSRVHFSFLNDSEEKQFECDICCKKFRFQSDMERHRSAIHLSFLK